MDNNFLHKFILNTLSDPILLTDDLGNFLFASSAMAIFLGYNYEEINGISNIYQLAESLLVDSKELDSKREIHNIEITITGHDDQEFTLLVNVKRVKLEEKSRLYSFRDITEHKFSEEKLRSKIKQLKILVEKRSSDLNKKSIALTEVLSHLEIEKQNVSSRVDVNVQKLLLPIIEKLTEKASSFDRRYLMLVKQNLEELTSSLGIKLTSVKYRLTPKEIEFCTLIKGGFSIKEIAVMQSLSERTVETHRFNIRKKLGITSSKINLATYLAQL